MTKPIPNRPFKARSHVLTGLIAKRREIAGQIEDLQGRLKIAVTELDNVESTIRIFEPNIDLTPFGPRPVPPPHTAFKGELSRILIDTLKASTTPLNTRQLTEVVMNERGMPVDHLSSPNHAAAGRCKPEQLEAGEEGFEGFPGPGRHAGFGD